jgi:hypothetical protein
MTMGNLHDLVAFAISTLTLHVTDRLSVFDGIDPKRYSSHAFRIGAATNLAVDGLLMGL